MQQQIAWFYFLAGSYSIVLFFIQLSVLRHLGCFQIWAMVNSAAANIGVKISFLKFLGPWGKCRKEEC